MRSLLIAAGHLRKRLAEVIEDLTDALIAPRFVNGVLVDPIRTPSTIAVVSEDTGPFPGTTAIRLGTSGRIVYNNPQRSISGDFTMETFINFDSLSNSNQYIFDLNDNSMTLRYYGANGIEFTHSGSLVSRFIPTVGVWYHIALVRKNGVTRMYIDGVATGPVGSGINDTFFYTKLTVGNYGGGGGYNVAGRLYGFKLSLRAVYDGNFVRPTH